jgi:hypothetical protein
MRSGGVQLEWLELRELGEVQMERESGLGLELELESQ